MKEQSAHETASKSKKQTERAPEAVSSKGFCGPVRSRCEGASLTPQPDGSPALPPHNEFETVVTKWVRLKVDLAGWVAWFTRDVGTPCIITRKSGWDGKRDRLYFRLRRYGTHAAMDYSTNVGRNVVVQRVDPWERDEKMEEGFPAERKQLVTREVEGGAKGVCAAKE